ncbi:MAG: PRC-barrel domain-containing protein [Candidatus Magasanikbacteria bacterium]|nr:PRC-barrel domain-containing protein [Candidatus Magasanikbacteria bacterium]
MLLLFSKLKNLPVFTQSGVKLGQIIDVEIDLDSQSILRYAIKRGIVSRGVLLIHRSQVVAITDEKMTVEDAMIKKSQTMNIKEAVVQPATGISARE